MYDIDKLIEYAHLSGHEIYVKGPHLMVKNGKSLPPQLERLIKVHRDDLYNYLKQYHLTLF